MSRVCCTCQRSLLSAVDSYCPASVPAAVVAAAAVVVAAVAERMKHAGEMWACLPEKLL